MKASKLSASVLRLILIVVVLLSVTASVGGFLLLRTMLVQKATDTAAQTAQAESSSSKLQALKETKRLLDANADVEAKALQMVPASANYSYQDKILYNIKAIGDKAGVKVQQISYGSSTDQSGSAAGTPEQSLQGGIKLTTADVTIENPVRYDRWLAFVHYIETSTMKMQISKIGITSTGKSENGYSFITSDAFTIGVYIR